MTDSYFGGDEYLNPRGRSRGICLSSRRAVFIISLPPLSFSLETCQRSLNPQTGKPHEILSTALLGVRTVGCRVHYSA